MVPHNDSRSPARKPDPMEALDPHACASERLRPRVELRVVELSAVSAGAGVWVPGPADPATVRAVERLRAVGYVLGSADAWGDLLDPFLVD